ncbi:uncharacterized protein LOC120623888 [Pararge aegeria]|uniref:uncharacterized protein LOC120623888 n=1 Tax=Pararge aegeria TaxID=116150 RepID=UPI0019CFD9F0|nr:uncharacterized protein LOC120623888 [Pararge aegeria]
MDLLEIQEEIKSQIDKLRINFKKCAKDRLTRQYIETRLQALETKYKEFTKNLVELIKKRSSLSTDYFSEDVFGSVEEFYLEFKTELKERLDSSVMKQQRDTSLNVTGNFNSAVKLPKITIPAFSGLYTEWLSFRDLFKSLIHGNEALDNVQKLHYLKGHLTGEAEQLVRHIPITNDTYIQCWTLLESRYNNKQYLANSILKRFFSHKNVTSESSTSIKLLLDGTNDMLNGLSNLEIDTSSWDIIVIYIVSQKLDSESRKLWEIRVSECSNKLPTINNFTEFLEHRFRSLEFLDTKATKQTIARSYVCQDSVKVTESCKYCDECHKIYNCKKFSQLSVDARREFVRSNSLCFNCLSNFHSAFSCRLSARCRLCHKKHHSLLHPLNPNPQSSDQGTQSDDQVVDSMAATLSTSPQSEATNVVSCFSNIRGQALLATAMIKAESKAGSTLVLRALLDQGSQASFITESAVQLLGLKKMPIKVDISRLGDEGSMPCKSMVSIKIQSRLDSSFVIEIQAYVLKKLTSFLPEKNIVKLISTLPALELADPFFGTPNKIDMVLSVGVYSKILLEGLIKGPPGTPIAQKTRLGWILSGDIYDPNSRNSELYNNVIVSMHVQSCENDILKKIWEIEECKSVSKKLLTEEEEKCEKLFSETKKRDNSGRYIIKLPFRQNDPPCKYGDSRHIARKRYFLLEKKLLRNPDLKVQYAAVIKEYFDLNHMEVVPRAERDKPNVVYLPHHAVIRNDKSTTKVRPVFDASCQGINGVSLNNDLMIGPTLQPELRQIIMRWRCHPICLIADIIKMYRQVKVFEEHVDFQRLYWRDSPDSDLQHFRLLRVTFGTSAAPYLAVRCLQQLAYDEGNDFPYASNRVLSDFYVDDLITGCETEEEGRQIYKEMNELLSRGGFQLQKWSTNSTDLMKEIETDNEGKDKLEIKVDTVVKILGITWNRERDEFQYTVQLPPLTTPVTKRREWIEYRANLKNLIEFRIPRWIQTDSKAILRELQGFCDASNAAYAAVIYLRVIDSQMNVHVHLITSKTKVSPIKQVSIPRLELCGAVLLAKLLNEVSNSMEISKENVHAWTDSSVVLAWLRSHPSKWKTFVGNRVSEILTIMESNQWSHVVSKDNPADCASRGISAEDCCKSKLWKYGPKWLENKTINYSKGTMEQTNLEEKTKTVICNVTAENRDETIISRFSSLRKLVRVISYCRRFILYKKSNNKEKWLTFTEINNALHTCIKMCQHEHFNNEIESLKEEGRVKRKSILLCLNPYLDAGEVLRVGGRLQMARIHDKMKHPVIIPHKSHFTDLLVADAHERTLHGGPQSMLNYLGTKYWVINARGLVRQHFRKCVTCVRYSAQANQQLMGQLPTARVTASRPFCQSGVDYAGPIAVRPHKGRGYHATKGYICLFICMATRAVHLEMVSDMTSQAFIAAFKRFTGRRGHCLDLWSDNGTTFVGANKELKSLFAKGRAGFPADIMDWLATNGTNWHFIPPHSPNFGGLWEAGIKSTKTHLNRVIGNHTLTFEEMVTVLTQIEACLNSRPIGHVSSNSEDPYPLTPGHFLIGEPVILVPENNYEGSNITTLQRWHLAQKLVQDFWRRWSAEYLTKFYHRHKWSYQTAEPRVGDVVLVKEDNLPPARWLYGIITQKHTGPDGLTRVVSLKCKKTIIKRSTSKLIILPVRTF